jgi:hypothetical protein
VRSGSGGSGERWHGWGRFRRRSAGSWTESGRGARGEGGEAVGRGDLGRVARSR